MSDESSAQVGSNNFDYYQDIITLAVNADASDLINTVSNTAEGRVNAVRLALLQVWMITDPAKQTEFMTKVSSFTGNFLVQFTDINFLAANGLMSLLLGSTSPGSDGAKFRLALTGVLGNNNDADSRTYLLSLLVNNSFPAALHISSALGGASSETAILTKLGVFSAAAAQVANIDVGATGTNTVFAERLNLPGEVDNPYGAQVFDRPDATSAELTTLNYGDSVQIIGRMPDWYAIQFVQGSATTPVPAFISRWSVTTLAPYNY